MKICVQFQAFKTFIPLRSRKTWENLKNFWKKEFWFLEKKKLAPIPIPKLDLGFGSWYRNLVWVANYIQVCKFIIHNIKIFQKVPYFIWTKKQLDFILFQPNCAYCCQNFKTYISSAVARANLNKNKEVLTSTTRASKYIPKRPRICISVNSVVEFPGAGLGRLITINSELNGAI